MEKQNSVVNGGIKLPIGYRFHPTEEELVVHYLKRKVFGLPLPASIIPELDVFQIHPLGLPGDVNEKKRYFFSNIRSGNANANANAKEAQCKVAAGSGYWKYVGKNRLILSSGTNQVVGIRRSLIFFEGQQRAHDTKTQWVMHEYLLVNISKNPSSTHLVSNLVIIGGWSVYRIFQRKKKPRKISGAVSNNIISSSHKNIQAIDFIIFQADQSDISGPPEPDSSCSSEITVDELSSSVLDQEETSTGCIIKHMNYRN